VRVYSFLFLLAIVYFAPMVRSQAVDTSERDPQFRMHRSVEEMKRDNERMKAMNKDRTKRIKRDTDKLLELATELKQYVDKTNENVLSVEVIKKAEEVEKLAKTIREKMKEDYRIPDDLFHP
jgi:ATP-dependent helicase/DNAse subunit B